MPHPVEWAAILARIADRSQKLIQDHLERRADVPLLSGHDYDFATFGRAMIDMVGHALSTPERMVDSQLEFWQDYMRLCQTSLARFTGQTPPPVIQPAPNDKRFQDAAWRDVWLFDFLKQSYLLTARWAHSLSQKADGLDPRMARRVDFYTRQVMDAMAPSNFWMTNPEVLRATMESGGENLVRGLDHLLNDLERGHGRLSISMSDTRAFRFGENIAATPGKVVFQNELFQLIQYAPKTATVHSAPMLIVPPWINKYYILDLRAQNSFIGYLVEQGHTVFCISWVNPDARHASVGFDDYLETGLVAALRETAKAADADRVNVVGYCIGGTLLASTLAWMKGAGKKQTQDLPTVASATYLVTLVDFAEPGELGVFMDDKQVSVIEEQMAKSGYMDARIMSTTFNMLRANDLIWSFVINNYLLGKEPFPFDLLAWNSDSTHLPAAMQSFYLRNMYLENKLIKPNALSMKGVPIDLRTVTTPSFLLSARDDHIAPWRSTYAATQIYKGPVTFVLSGSGHIAGVINHPSANKYGYWTNDKTPADPDAWFDKATAHSGSWWPAWVAWLKPYAGSMVPAREPGQDGSAIEAAPGSYVQVRAA